MSIKELFKSKHITAAAVLLGLFGILLIFLSELLPSGENKKTDTAVTDTELYRKQLQQEVAELVKGITGDSEVTVVITLEGGTEYIYATERNSDSGTKQNKESSDKYNKEISDKTEEKYIIIKTDNGEQPLLLSALAPAVRGVAVVCDSAGTPQIAESVKAAVCTLLDISEKKVTVTGNY